MKPLSKGEIALKFLSAPCFFADETFQPVALDWLQGEFWNWFVARRWRDGLKTWTRKNDCDNFARAYAQAVDDCWAATPGDGTEADSAAVGEFWYVRQDKAAHAVVVAFTDKGTVFLEPQTGATLALSESEIASCFYARF